MGSTDAALRVARPRGAEPRASGGDGEAHRALTSLFAATVFVGLLNQFGGYQLKQLPRLHWQLRHILMTWSLTVAVLLVIGFFSKTSDVYSRGWMLSWIVTVPML